jgi:protein gp37
MGETTEISWTDHTFNPWAGCTKVSPACDNCYAEKDTNRRGYVQWGKDAARRRTSPSYWKQLEKWNKSARKEGVRRRVFIGSWCDIMEDRTELQVIREELYPIIEGSDWLDILMLTKSPQNFRKFLPASWLEKPLPNVWGMTTMESQNFMWRVESLLSTPFAIRGVSMEPLLGPVHMKFVRNRCVRCEGAVDLFTDNPYGSWKAGVPANDDHRRSVWCARCGFSYDDVSRIDWVIVGGESQVGSRAMNPDWARHLRDQCVFAEVAFHFKQWGEHNEHLVNIGKKQAGRILDGRIWAEFPKTTYDTANVK